jgi:hypothetical protein
MSVNPVQAGLAPFPSNVPIVDKQGMLTPVFRAWFTSLYTYAQGLGQNGATTARPTAGLFIGRQYFDTTLGYMVAVKTVSPSVVWVNGAGAPV